MKQQQGKQDKKMRKESDLIGELEIPADVYYGVQTQRAVNNFDISTAKLSHYRTFIWALGAVKKAAALANHELGLLDDKITDAIVQACDEVMEGRLDDQFPIDMIQGGAGT